MENLYKLSRAQLLHLACIQAFTNDTTIFDPFTNQMLRDYIVNAIIQANIDLYINTCTCNDQGQGQYHLPHCHLYIEPI